MGNFLFFLMGFLFAVLGNILYSVKQNFFIGARLPWTLSNEENWNRTNRLMSKLFFASGLNAQTTNLFSDAEVEGRLFAQKVIAQMIPQVNYSNSVILSVRMNKGSWTNYTVTSKVVVGKDQWKNIFY